MTSGTKLVVLVVEDDKDDMTQLRRDLPKEMGGVVLRYEFCDTFDDGFDKARARRYDLILSDTYRGEYKQRNAEALKLVREYRGGRFCPLVLFSNGTKPDGLDTSAFVLWVEKDKIEGAMKEVLATGIPQLAKQLHDELDRSAGGYLWGFLEGNWDKLCGLEPTVLERLVRRRAAVQFGSLTYDGEAIRSIDEVYGLEFYIYPPIAQNGYCLGDLVREKRNHGNISLILTPHCHVVVQPGDDKPRAEHVLLVRLRQFGEVLAEEGEDPWKGSKERKLDSLRKRTQLPSQIGCPRGRYCFLPGFMDIPDGYCDLMRLTSIAIDDVQRSYERIATVASPFAEAIQSCLTRFYGSVGVPSLRQDSIERLIQ